MRLSSTLSLYVGRHFISAFLVLLLLFMLLVLLFDTVELLRRSASKPHIDFSMVLEMALLKLPYMCQEIFPFAVLFAGMASFWRLTRSNELVVTRSAGVSAWQFLLPPVTIAAPTKPMPAIKPTRVAKSKEAPIVSLTEGTLQKAGRSNNRVNVLFRTNSLFTLEQHGNRRTA